MTAHAVLFCLAGYGLFELWMRTVEWAGRVRRRRGEFRVREQQRMVAALRAGGPRVLPAGRVTRADRMVLDDMGVGRAAK